VGHFSDGIYSIVRGAAELLSADIVVIYPYDVAKHEFMQDRVVIGGKSKGETLKQAGPAVFATKVVEQGIIAVEDMPTTKDYLSSEDVGGSFIERENIKAFAGVALRVGGETVGVLYINFRTRHRFTEEEKQIIKLFASQAAIAIQNARLYSQTRDVLDQRTLQLEALREVDRAISATLDLDEALNLILDKAIELTSAHAGYIHMVDTQNAELVTRASRGADEERQRRRIKPGEGITGWVAQHRHSMLVPDVRQDPRYLSIIPGMMSELAVPLMSGGELIGVLNVESQMVNAFSSDDLRLLEALASQSVIAIKNATLFAETRKRAEELR
jgi:GAF domain-containing protein